MPIPSFTTTVTRKHTIARDVIEFTCEKPEGFSFRAGQFVMIDAPRVEDPTDIQPRAYSIASAPHETELLFVVKLKEGGRFSTYLSQAVEIGTLLRLQGPLGMFTLRPTTHHTIFVATGSGIAPFRAHLEQWSADHDPRKITLVYGVRHVEEWIWKDELRARASTHRTLDLRLCLSGDDDTWTGLRGRVTDHLGAVLADPLHTDLYVCGSPAMVKDVKTMATETLGIPKEQVFGEGYI